MEFPSQVLYIEEVVIYAPHFDEGALGVGDKAIHVRGESSGHHLGY